MYLWRLVWAFVPPQCDKYQKSLDWLQSLKQFFINVSYQILVASLTLMALFSYQILEAAGPHSAVGNVSGFRCVYDSRSRGSEFDPGPVPYFRGDWSWNDFYGHSPPFCWFIQEGLLSVTSESLCTNLFKPAQEKVLLGELTMLLTWDVKQQNKNTCS